MNKLSKRDSLLLVIIGVVAVLGGIFWFYVKPAKADLTAKQEAAIAAQDGVTQLQAELAKASPKAAAKTPKAPLADELRLAKAFPYSEDSPNFILQAEDLAGQTNVLLGSSTATEGKDFAGVTGTSFTLEITGKYLNVQDFVYRLHDRVRVDNNGKLRVKGRLIAVTKVDITKDEKDTSNGSTGVDKQNVKATITLVAFSRSAAGAATADGGAPAGGAAAPSAATNTGGSPS